MLKALYVCHWSHWEAKNTQFLSLREKEEEHVGKEHKHEQQSDWAVDKIAVVIGYFAPKWHTVINTKCEVSKLKVKPDQVWEDEVLC